MSSSSYYKNYMFLFCIILPLVLINCIFNSTILLHEPSLENKVFAFIVNVGFSSAFIAFIYVFRTLFLPIYIITLLFGSLLAYFKQFFGIIFNAGLMRCLVNTNYKESIAFLDTSLIIWMFIFFIIPSVFLIKKRKWMIQEFGKRIKISLIVIFIGVGLFYSPLIFMKNPPYRFLQEMIDTDLYPSNLIRILKKWHGVHYNTDSGIKRDVCEGRKLQFNDKGLKLILVIGESARSDRFGINGYNRNTTPNLAKISKLVSFKDVYSLDTYTIQGIKNMLQLNANNNENSIISVLKNLGFKTYWLSAQPSTYEVDDLAYESDVVIPKQKISNSPLNDLFDEDLLKPLQDILNKTSNDENLLIVLHTYGSHSKYDDRYTENFKKFGPTCSSIEHSLKNKLLASRSSCNFSVEASNSYDNTILYTDYFLSQVINILKPYKSMMMYVSDHGESLGENGIYLHGYKYDSAPKEQLHIPYMIWFSHEFLNDKKIASNLKVASENIFKKIDQSSVFHSLLDCINVDSDIIDNKKSVCSSSLGEGNFVPS